MPTPPTSPETAAMNVIPLPSVSSRTSLGDSRWFNLTVWFFGILVSMLPLLVVPIVRFFVKPYYDGWVNDVFSNVTILMVAVSLAVMAIFELVAKRHGGKIEVMLGCLLAFLTLACIFIYGIARGIGEYRYISNPENFVALEFASLNMAFLGTMFILGLIVFISRKR